MRVPLLAIASLFQQFQCVQSTLPQFPSIRFTIWADLDEDVRNIASFLDYEEDSWNHLMVNPLEWNAFWTIFSREPEKSEVIRDLGFSEQTWDCWVNHYSDYYWYQIEHNDLDTYFETLGWNETLWVGDAQLPETETKSWNELTPNEQEAASNLCFTRYIWDAVTLSDWSTVAQLGTESTTFSRTEPSSSSTFQTTGGSYSVSTANPMGTSAGTFVGSTFSEPGTTGTVASSTFSRQTATTTPILGDAASSTGTSSEASVGSTFSEPGTTRTAASSTFSQQTATTIPTLVDTGSSTGTFATTTHWTWYPTEKPSDLPSLIPTARPTLRPSMTPSAQPSSVPSDAPSSVPSQSPSASPSIYPTEEVVHRERGEGFTIGSSPGSNASTLSAVSAGLSLFVPVICFFDI